MLELKHPECMEIHEDQTVHHGGSQDWYADWWWRRAGCGPTAAANLIWYRAHAHPHLYTPKMMIAGDRDIWNYINLQDEMFTYVTPARGGVNTSVHFRTGMMNFASNHGVVTEFAVLEVPEAVAYRPSDEMTLEFIAGGLKVDAPIAFLNLHNGNQSKLERWHWVTIVSLDPDSRQVVFSDHGHLLEMDIVQWLQTTERGGAFLYLL